jgi:hypothetical protein
MDKNAKGPPEQAYVHDVKDSKELIQKELDVNRAEQVLLVKRIALVSDFLQDIPSHDPQYGALKTQAQMDQIEVDELKVREDLLLQRLVKTFSNQSDLI